MKEITKLETLCKMAEGARAIWPAESRADYLTSVLNDAIEAIAALKSEPQDAPSVLAVVEGWLPADFKKRSRGLGAILLFLDDPRWARERLLAVTVTITERHKGG